MLQYSRDFFNFIAYFIRKLIVKRKNPNMKNRVIVHGHEEAKIYKHNYRPSFSVARLLRSVLGVIITGQSLAAHKYHYRRK